MRTTKRSVDSRRCTLLRCRAGIGACKRGQASRPKRLRYTKRRTTLEAILIRFLIGSFTLLSAVAFAQQTVPEIPFDSVPNFLKLPADLHLGEVSGVAVNSKGHTFVFSRGNTNGPAYGATASQVL